jgi:hypothetical protein
MTTIEQEIKELELKQKRLKVESDKEKLLKRYEELKKLEGTVEVRIIKSSKKSRFAHIVHHISYEMIEDNSENEFSERRYYIGVHAKRISIKEFPDTYYRNYAIETLETNYKGYNGKLYLTDNNNYYDFSTYKTISIEEFNNIWFLAKTVTKQVLDGVLDIKEIRWLMTGSDEDKEFKETEISKEILDIPYILLSQEESWKLNNKFCHLFLNKNIYFITPNSLKALDNWYADEIKHDNLAYNACAYVGERWRGSRIDEYKRLIDKIKNSTK